MLKVSAIVPVYNPGSRIDKCIESLVGQSLPRDQYEVVFVDDGSTDGTGARLDALAAEHPHVRVEHIPNSGWPGKPRNVGIGMARGEFVYFVDNDDHVGHEALERLYQRAVADEADVVVGRVTGHGKFVPRPLFARNRSGVTFEWAPLLRLLTPHKLFRRALLDEHGIRFPEGRRRLEDHVFVMHAYFHARAISILADYPCYHWVLAEEDESASYQPFDAEGYFANLRGVLDLVEEHTEPGELRERLLAHWYRSKMLGRLGPHWFPNRRPDDRRAVYEEVRALALERYGPWVDRFLGRSVRVRSHLLREGSFDQLSALAFWQTDLRPEVTVDLERFSCGAYAMPFEARLLGPGEAPLLFERRGERLLWVPPPELGLTGLPDELRDMTEAFERTAARISIRSLSDATEFLLPARHEVSFRSVGDLVTPVLSGEARIEPGRAGTAAGGWALVADLTVCGFGAVGKVRARQGYAEYAVELDSHGAVVGRYRGAPLSGVKGRLVQTLPGLARVARRRQRRRRTSGAAL